MRGLNVWNDGVFELANLCLESVATVEEHNFVATFGYQGINLSGLEVLASADDATRIHLNFVRSVERNQFRTHAHAKARKIIAGAVRPLEVDLFEARVLLGLAHVLL